MAEQKVYAIEEKRLSPITDERIDEILDAVKNIQFHNLWRRGYSETVNLLDSKTLGKSLDTVCGACLDFASLVENNNELVRKLKIQNETVDMFLFILKKHKVDVNKEIEIIRHKKEQEEKRTRANTGKCEKTSSQS